jgi:hypothetical protein
MPPAARDALIPMKDIDALGSEITSVDSRLLVEAMRLRATGPVTDPYPASAIGPAKRTW